MLLARPLLANDLDIVKLSLLLGKSRNYISHQLTTRLTALDFLDRQYDSFV